MIVTQQQILTGLRYDPCIAYPAERIVEIFNNQNEMPLLEALQLHLPAQDIMRATLLYKGILADCHLHELACRYAEHNLSKVDCPNPCSIAAIAAKRAWTRGEIGNRKLQAARKAAWVATWDVAWGAAPVAAAWMVARDAAWAAAWVVAQRDVTRWEELLQITYSYLAGWLRKKTRENNEVV